MTTSAVPRLIESFASPDTSQASEAVERAGRRLRQGGLDRLDVALIGEAFQGLSRHKKWEVRQSVAEALVGLRHPTFDVTLAALLKDPNSFVRDSAERTQARRSARSQADFVVDREADEVFPRLLAEHEDRYGHAARAAAEKLAKRHTELFVRAGVHEILNALHPLDATLEALQERLRSGSKKRPAELKLLKWQLRHLSAVTNSIRNASLQVTPSFRAECLRDLVEDALQQAGIPGKLRGRPRIKVDVSIDPALILDADRSRLLQALLNILKNAKESLDGLRRPGRVWVEAHPERGGKVVITIRDNGCGMPEEVCQKAFGLYHTTKRDRGGTGAGLFNTRKVVQDEHNGLITLESEPGQGTIVTMVLPQEQTKTGRIR